MKRLLLFCAFVLCIAVCSKGGDSVLPDAPGKPSVPGISDRPAVQAFAAAGGAQIG